MSSYPGSPSPSPSTLGGISGTSPITLPTASQSAVPQSQPINPLGGGKGGMPTVQQGYNTDSSGNVSFIPPSTMPASGPLTTQERRDNRFRYGENNGL
jgi:hypothetical protein